MSALERIGYQGTIQSGVNSTSATQDQTKDAFGFKWSMQEAYDHETTHNQMRSWLVERYLDGDPGRLKEILDRDSGAPKLILDAGCGAGLSAALLFGQEINNHDYLGVDISESIKVARNRFADMNLKGDFLQLDLMQLPFQKEVFDIVFSEGVLHHTDCTKDALIELTTFLKPGGLFMFYVYRKKAVIREFTDDYIREQIKPLDDEDAWNALLPLTRLGKALGELNAEITVPEDVPYLGITAGTYNLQRFVYWNICKMFYRPEMSLEEMNHTNFDWFRPLNCQRHTEKEVRDYCALAGLQIEKLRAEEAGFTVIAKKES